ncbi:hypothetical protein RhiirB3_409317 [Rhizophagus irregularis]|nr:hypothetical protein RhiirB3_409317 [Rhizophagus irregularis]
MVSIDKLTREELTTIIAQELHIDVAFPCFSVEEQTGATACCVVHKHWLATLKQAKFGETIQLKRYNNNNRSPLNSNNSDQSNTDDRQSSTTNVLVSVFLKHQVSDNRRPQLFSKFNSCDKNAPLHNFGEETEVPLRTFLKEQLEAKEISSFADIETHYYNYVPDKNSQNDDDLTDLNDFELQLARQKVFVKKFIEVLYPESAYFRIKSPHSEIDNGDILSMELLSDPDWSSDVPTTSPNLIDVFAVLESDRAFYFMAPYRGTTLQDLLKFSSGILNSNVKKLFILYQILKTIQKLHQKGVIHGGLRPSNIFVDENLWVTIAGFECSVPVCDDATSQCTQEIVLGNIPKEIQDDTLTMKWVRGDISNFDYIMSLNYLAGRRIGDPNFHPIFPWITDFTGLDISQNWRDFTKTKFRLNKGDEQLDFTFDGPVPHHITDILSDITYYVYLARKTPIPILCQYVRTKYEPNEYPSSLQRLFEWTPDECIPEFYTDPSIFTSIHPDMPDLQLPVWASSAEEFIRIHSEALESDYVSSNLNLWIDLTFGCKLSGEDAIEAKNVALPLINGHNSFMKHGITQLFSDLHPQKSVQKISKQHSLVYKNEDRTLLENYEIMSSKRRIPLKMIETDFKTTSETLTDFLNINGSEKTIGKSYHQSTTSNSKISKSPKLEPATSRSLSLYGIINNLDEKKDHPTHPTTVMVTNSDLKDRVETLTSLINAIPIHLPDDMRNEFFIEKLNNFEQAHSFATKYVPNRDNSKQNNIGKRDIVQDSQSKRASIHDGIMKSNETSFVYGRAWDAYCFGKIIENIYDTSKNVTSLSLLCNTKNKENKKENICKFPLPVQEIISSLTDPDWRKRPSIDAILYCSVPVMSLHDQGTTLPLPDCIPEVYEFLTDFHQVDWIGRLKLAEHWMDKLCNLTDEAFYMILPSLVLLFTNDSIKFEALNIFSKLGQRLGQDETKAHLLKPIVSLFESSRPSIPKILFDSAIIEEFIHKFGIPNFLQQLFPLYLESLTIEENVLPYTFGITTDIETQHSYDNQFNLKNTKYLSGKEIMSGPASTISASLDNALPSVAQLANEALVDICTLIGPILSNKYVMKQVYKMFLRESPTLNFLMQSVLAIGNQFGETFIQLQFSQVMGILQQYSYFTMNNKNYIILCNHLSLLGKLTTLMPSSKILTEIESGLSDILTKLLLLFGEESDANVSKSTSITNKKEVNNTNKKSNLLTQIMKNKLSISVKTMEFILHICNNIGKVEWKKHIAPILIKYFELFEKSVQSNGNMDEATLSRLEQERDQQIIYAYSQFCILFEPETIRQIIPNSNIFETASLVPSGSYSNSTSSSLHAMSPSLSSAEIPSDQVSIISSSSDNTLHKEKSSVSSLLTTSSTSLRLNINEDKKHLPLLTNTNNFTTKEAIITTTATAMTTSEFSVNRTFSLLGSGEITSRKLLDINHNNITNIGERGSPIRTTRKMSVGGLSTSIPSKNNSGNVKKSKLKGINLSWKTKNSSQEDLKNWTRFLSTNSEEMSNSMQFTFNDLKLRTFQGHGSAIRSINTNEYSRLIVSGSKDRTVKLWSLNIHHGIENSLNEPYSECLKTYTGHKKNTILDTYFISRGESWGLGNHIVSCDGQIHIWDPETGITLHQFGNLRIPYLSIKPIFRARYLVGGLSDTTITFFDTMSSSLLHSWKSGLGFTGIIKTICINPSETLIAVGFSSGIISLLESRTGTLIYSWKASDTDITHLKFYANNRLVSCASTDHIIYIWNTDNGCLINTVKVNSDIIALNMYKDEVITINNNNNITFSPLNENFQTYSSKFKSSIVKSSITCLEILPINQLLILGCLEGDLFLYA